MSAFDPKDLWGVAGAMLLLIFVYLVLTNGTTSASIISSGGNAVGLLIKDLQGRG